MFSKKIRIISLAIFLIAFLLTVQMVFAQSATTGGGGHGGSPGGGGPGETPSATTIEIKNPFKTGDNLYTLLYTILDKAVLPVGGIVVAIMIMWSGFQFVMARGNEELLKVARRSILYTAIGAGVLLGAVALSKIIETTINAIRS